MGSWQSYSDAMAIETSTMLPRSHERTRLQA